MPTKGKPAKGPVRLTWHCRTYSLYANERLGSVVWNIGGWEAWPSNFHCVGVFPKRADAMRAVEKSVAKRGTRKGAKHG